MDLTEIIKSLEEKQDEIKQLQHEKAQAEAFCAAIVRNSKEEIVVTYKDIFKSDYEKVKVYPHDGDEGRITVKYIE